MWATYGVLARTRPTERGIAYGSERAYGDGVLIVLSMRDGAQQRKEHRYSIHTKKQGGACDMRDAETVLGMLQARGTRGLKVDDLYRQLYNPLLYVRAYGRIYSNDGAMTKGATTETADGMSLAKIEEIIESLKRGTFRWTPVRRTYIPKKNGKQRPLGLPMLRSYCPPYRVLSGFRCRCESAQLTHAASTVPYFARVDESPVVSNGAESACAVLR